MNKEKAIEFLSAHDTYHILFYACVKSGWNPQEGTKPKILIEAHSEMVDAYKNLFQDVMGFPRPDYEAMAEKHIERCPLSEFELSP